MNRDKAYRQAVVAAISNLTIDYGEGSVNVPVYDNKLESNRDIYVIIPVQTALIDYNFALQMWRCTIELEINHRQQNSATMDVVDMVSEEIENAIITAPGVSTLIEPLGWRIHNTFLTSAQTFKVAEVNDSGLIVMKTLIFTSELLKQ